MTATAQTINNTPDNKLNKSSIRKVEVKTFLEELVCTCGGIYSRMASTASSLQPPQYPYQCQRCKKVEMVVGKPYPRTIIERGNAIL